MAPLCTLACTSKSALNELVLIGVQPDEPQPRSANRCFYSNSRLDSLVDQARKETDQDARRKLYAEVQKILAVDLPYINLWYYDNVLLHSKKSAEFATESLGKLRFFKDSGHYKQTSLVLGHLPNFRDHRKTMASCLRVTIKTVPGGTLAIA